MPHERRTTLLSCALICFGLGVMAFAYVVHKTIAYVLHPHAFGGTQLSDAVLSRADLGGGILFAWLCVLLGSVLALWTLPPRARQPGLLVVAALLALGGIDGVLYSLQGWRQFPNLAQQWEGLGALAIYPWIGVSFLSIVVLLVSICLVSRVLFVRTDHAEGASLSE